MIKRKVAVFALSFTFFSANAQGLKPGLYVGIDLFKSLPTYFDAGYTIEPSLIYVLKNNGLKIDAVTGISDVSTKVIYGNVNYKNSGRYYKLGLRKEFGGDKNFDGGLSLGYTSYTETGKTVLAGNYFGSYTIENRQENKLFFMEASFSYQIRLLARLYLVPQVRWAYALSAFNTDSFPAYSAPGIGYLRPFVSDYTLQSAKGSFGLSARLVYKIF
jgi:hypothetical protein